MKGHAAVARALAENDVQVIFGLMGDANMFHITEFMESEKRRFVGAVVEGGALGMADGYSRVSGKVGVASVTHGPGAANCVNAMMEAVRAHSSVVLICGDTPAVRNYPQHVSLEMLFAATGADFHRVVSPEHLVEDIAFTLERALASRKPVVLDIPIVIQNADLDYRSAKPRIRVASRVRPDPSELDWALGLLVSAKRPIILAGRGAVVSEARSVLIRLADILGAPLATTASAKDLFHGHPYNLGIMGEVSPSWASEVMSKADCVVSFGAGLNQFTTFGFELLEGRRVIQCEIDPQYINRYWPADVALTGDAAGIAEMMVEQLEALDLPAGGFRTGQLGEGVLERSPRDEFRDRSTSTHMDMRTAMTMLEEMLPLDKVLVTDGGRFKIAPWRYLHLAEARKFIQTLGSWASIGLGVSAGIGAAVASAGDIAICVTGDGGAMMGLIEFSTAVRHDIPFVLVVLNDGAYGPEFTKLERHGYDPGHSLIPWPDFAAMAIAMGGDGVTIRTAEKLKSVGVLLSDLQRPLLIDVKADPAVDPREV